MPEAARRSSFRRLLGDQSGNALAIFAGALAPLIVLVGSGLDLGVAYMAQAKLQNACDAGVLAGRQNMPGNNFTTNAQSEAQRFFAFNFPNGSHGVNPTFTVTQSTANPEEIVGRASGTVPTTLMRMFGYQTLSINAACDATRDMGHNDVVLVLDVTGSMDVAPSTGGSKTKIQILRDSVPGLYRALATSANGSITRYGIVPYSHTVNVAGSLANTDILGPQQYQDGDWSWEICDTDGRRTWNCIAQARSRGRPSTGFTGGGNKFQYPTGYNNNGQRTVELSGSSWAAGGGGDDGIRTRFRTSGNGCIEERPSIGNSASPVRIGRTVTRADVDSRAASSSDAALQFGRYDPAVQNGHTQDGCPSPAARLRTISDEAAFNAAISAATARVTGGTYHDVGMLWGTRFISRTGFFRADNPAFRNDIAVNQHIVFMTDGKLDTGSTLYSAHGVEQYQTRSTGNGTQDEKHIARFQAACNVARRIGVTVWVISFDVTDNTAIRPCATSDAHFYVADDAADLEEAFKDIGQGIGNLRLTK